MLAAVYVRISDDAEGLGLGVARQEADCRALAAQLNWTVAGVYSDNDRSAYSGKPRTQYEALLRDLEAGVVDALVCWDVDRLTRSPIELERFIELAERLGVSLASVGGEIDLATPQGRLTARIKGSVARHEVEQASRRIRRKTLERAEAGRPHGRVAYGWRRVEGRDVLVEEQAAVVREVADRLLTGESLHSITADLNRRQVPTPREAPAWERAMVRQLVARERNAGLRVHQGKVIGRGDWEPIFSEDVWVRLSALMARPGTKRPTTPHKHLLSGIARCGVCGEPMRVLVAHGTRPKAYVCPKNYCVRRKLEAVDAMVTKLVLARLAQPDAAQAVLPADNRDLVERAHALRARLDLVADQFASDLIDGQQLARITAKLRPELEAVERELARTVAPDLQDLVRPNLDWDSVPLERKRAIINLLLTVRILPVGKTGRAAFDASGVQVEWRAALEDGAAEQG